MELCFRFSRSDLRRDVVMISSSAAVLLSLSYGRSMVSSRRHVNLFLFVLYTTLATAMREHYSYHFITIYRTFKPLLLRLACHHTKSNCFKLYFVFFFVSLSSISTN